MLLYRTLVIDATMDQVENILHPPSYQSSNAC